MNEALGEAWGGPRTPAGRAVLSADPAGGRAWPAPGEMLKPLTSPESDPRPPRPHKLPKWGWLWVPLTGNTSGSSRGWWHLSLCTDMCPSRWHSTGTAPLQKASTDGQGH